ncbi:MAG: MBL fold metallo-hydrolase [Candidatus Sungbacteria bacterium]|nr:MBL fold metallo-hydrolase [Candidatus Sungbacteria bacterium]
MEKIRNNIKSVFIATFLGSAALIWYLVFYFEARQNLLFTVFDVGQGDAIFLELGGKQILIDGGPDEKILSKLGRRMPFWDRYIDLLILTHPHADHLTGLLEVVKRYDVGMILETKVNYTTPEYEEWRRLLKKKNINIVVAQAGQVVRMAPNAYVDILAPRENFAGGSPGNVHDAMIVAKLHFGASSALLTGDAEKITEYKLVFFEGARLGSDILKVGHHGSKTSTTEDFLRTVSPKIAIISSGRKNRYGHPHQEVIDRLKDFGVHVLRTDEKGDIKMKSDGVKVFYE